MGSVLCVKIHRFVPYPPVPSPVSYRYITTLELSLNLRSLKNDRTHQQHEYTHPHACCVRIRLSPAARSGKRARRYEGGGKIAASSFNPKPRYEPSPSRDGRALHLRNPRLPGVLLDEKSHDRVQSACVHAAMVYRQR